MAKFNDMVNAIRTEYPAGYFETKFERPLQLSDFTAAVVPNDIPSDVGSRLKDAGVEVIEYEKGDNASRAEAMQKASQMENVRFSLIGEQGAAALDMAEEATIEAERKAIIETAKANGTYLKASNGKDTNLTPEQWVDVRTSRFKKWFGDWELANLYSRALEAWNNKGSKGKVVFGLSDRAKARFAELLGKDIKQLVITDDAIRHIKKKHSERETLRGQKDMTPEDVVIIPYLINNYDTMELSPEFDDNKGNRAITIKKRINGVSVVATIEKGNNKEFLVTSYQFVKSDALDASNETPELNVRNDSDIAKVQKDIENIKSAATNSSKIVDENGEPKVVSNIDVETYLANAVREGKVTTKDARNLLENYWKGVNTGGEDLVKQTTKKIG